jgi:hypothetical protein
MIERKKMTEEQKPFWFDAREETPEFHQIVLVYFEDEGEFGTAYLDMDEFNRQIWVTKSFDVQESKNHIVTEMTFYRQRPFSEVVFWSPIPHPLSLSSYVERSEI